LKKKTKIKQKNLQEVPDGEGGARTTTDLPDGERGKKSDWE
jgi:hypothetical protein